MLQIFVILYHGYIDIVIGTASRAFVTFPQLMSDEIAIRIRCVLFGSLFCGDFMNEL